jgi:hypothetical protein
MKIIGPSGDGVIGRTEKDLVISRFGHLEIGCAAGGLFNREITKSRNREMNSPDGPITRSPDSVRPWNVVHACEWARDVLPLVEAQLAVGMRPFLLTPGGYGAASLFLSRPDGEHLQPVSLLKTWNHVRDWRKMLTESSVESSSDVVHAHSFAAGMAAVRASAGVVYQFTRAVEKLAGGTSEDSWLARSFRVAEQFVLTRAAAVVTPDRSSAEDCISRGVARESAFTIPPPANPEWFESFPDRAWLNAMLGCDKDAVVFAVSTTAEESWLSYLRAAAVPHNLRFVFASESTFELANSGPVSFVAPQMRSPLFSSADVVICDEASPDAVEALALGRALLAADSDVNRAVSPDGQGCLWFRAGDFSDMLERATGLAQNLSLRRALGQSGREFCRSTRSPEAIGARYDAVYRLASAQRRDREASPPKAQLIPVQAL